MDSLHLQQVEYEAQRAQANRQELVERIARAIRDDGRVEPLNGLYLNRVSSPTEPVHGVSDLSKSFAIIIYQIVRRGSPSCALLGAMVSLPITEHLLS